MIDLKKLEDNLDKALANETKESLTNWLKDQRLSDVIEIDEITNNSNSICNNDYWWK